MIHLVDDGMNFKSPTWHSIKMRCEKGSLASPIPTHRETAPINAANGLQYVPSYTSTSTHTLEQEEKHTCM